MSDRQLSPQDRALLTDLVNGDRTENDPQVRERLAASAAFAAEVAAVQAVTTALQQHGAVRHGEIAAAQAAVSAADIVLARTMIRQHLPRRFRLRWLVAAAAAAVLLGGAATWMWWPRAGTSERDPTLGEAPVDRDMQPRGDVRADKLHTFRWVDAGGGVWQIDVYLASDGRKVGYEPLFPQQRVVGDQWQPTEEQIAAMRAAGEIVWELRPVRDGAAGAVSRAGVHCLP